MQAWRRWSANFGAIRRSTFKVRQARWELAQIVACCTSLGDISQHSLIHPKVDSKRVVRDVSGTNLLSRSILERGVMYHRGYIMNYIQGVVRDLVQFLFAPTTVLWLLLEVGSTGGGGRRAARSQRQAGRTAHAGSSRGGALPLLPSLNTLLI